MSAADILAQAWPSLYKSGKIKAVESLPEVKGRDKAKLREWEAARRKRRQLAGLTTAGTLRMRGWQSLVGMTAEQKRDRKAEQKRVSHEKRKGVANGK